MQLIKASEQELIMSYAFISYARKNKDFVVKLHEAMKQAGAASWVDWKDIPPSAQCMDEIQRAIVGADAFVFVITPQSAESRTCGWEISSAAENNKRIIPILIFPTETKLLPKAICDRNWILSGAEDDFGAA